MARITCANGLEKNHGGMAVYASAVLSSLPGDSEILLCEAENMLTARRRDDRLLVLSHGDNPQIERRGGNMVRVHYPTGQGSSDYLAARAAVIAAAAQAGDMVCADTGSIAMLNLAARVAASNIPVLVEGPTGTGKEVLARFIHNNSARSDGPFVALNCAAMPETMLEALLFGHRKGAFTGATEASEGFFRAADGGTLLLDEIGEMPLGLQAKLLRALQEGEIVPLGSTQPVPIDVRIVACTNRDLPQEIADGNFREDLYYRLNVFPLRLEALRERRGDIAPLAFVMLMRHAADPAMIPWISEEALARLQDHAWPGNIRELENVIRRGLLLAGDGQEITSDHIVFDNAVRPLVSNTSAAPQMAAIAAGGSRLSAIVRQSEAQVILDTLDDCGGNRLNTAARLGISERTLRYRLASLREAGMAAAGGR